MHLSRAPRTSDHFGRYYTDKDVAGLLVRSMSVKNPGLVIDLGAGNGALVGEASKHWAATRFVTVDIDTGAFGYQMNHNSGSVFTHHLGDALDCELAEKIGVRHGSVDSALCNPPYVRPKWRKHFGEILEDAGLSSIIPKLGCVPADILFIAQNLRFLREGGKLGLILADGIVAGEKYAKLRSCLATEHRLERVIELPRRVFRNTDAKAHIVVLSKHGSPNDPITVQRLERTGELSAVINLNAEQAAARLDYSYLVSSTSALPRSRGVLLRNVTEVLTRGPHSSTERKSCEYPVFHTTDFRPNKQNLPSAFVLNRAAAKLTSGALAQPGDILIARVGRNLEQKVCMVTRGAVAISDCVLLLRVQPNYRERALKYLCSSQGREVLTAASHGVGARFITTDAVLNITI